MSNVLQGAVAIGRRKTLPLSFFFPFDCSKILFTAILLSIGAVGGWSQAPNDYRTAGNGNWNALTTWERYNGTTWLTPTAGQGVPVPNKGIITILNGDTVTVTSTPAITNADQVHIEAGAMVLINGGATLRIHNSTDSLDLIIDGVIDNSGTLTRTGSPTTAVNGTLLNRNSVTLTAGASILYFNANSRYQHQRNGGPIPAATIWDTLSTVEVLGIVNSVPTGLNQVFGNFIWNNPGQTGFLNLTDNFTVTGNMEIHSTGDPLAGLRGPNTNPLVVPGNFIQTGGVFRLANGDNNRQLIVGGDFIMSAGELQLAFGGNGAMGIGSLRAAGNVLHTGGLITDAAAGTGHGVIEFNGTALPQIYADGGTYSGQVDFLVDSLSTLQMNDDFTVIVSDGSFTLQPGATLGITSIGGITASGPLGNIQVSGTRTFSPQANYIYSGSLPQVTGSGLPANVARLTLSHTGDGVTLSQPLTIDSAIVFDLGVLNTTTTNSLTLIAGAQAQNASNLSFVSGPVVKIGGSDFTFPIGKDVVYAPLTISMLDNPTDIFSAEYFNDPAPDNESFADSVQVVSLTEYWDLHKISAAPSSVFVTLSWRSTSGVVEPSDLLVVHYDAMAGEWTSEGIGTFVDDPDAGTIQSQVEVASFSFFTLGSKTTDNPLPVELVSFTATPKGKTVQLDWHTATELNNAFFHIERSANGRDFESIGKVAGAGTTRIPQSYVFTDVLPLNGWNYYRLRQEDTNGAYAYSPVQAVQMGKEGADIRLLLFPNPAGNELNLRTDYVLQATDRLEIFDHTGRLLQEFAASQAVSTPLNLAQLPAGTYVVRLRTAAGVHTASFVKQ